MTSVLTDWFCLFSNIVEMESYHLGLASFTRPVCIIHLHHWAKLSLAFPCCRVAVHCTGRLRSLPQFSWRGYEGLFWFGAVMDKAAVSILGLSVLRRPTALVSLGYVPRGGTAGPKGTGSAVILSSSSSKGLRCFPSPQRWVRSLPVAPRLEVMFQFTSINTFLT